jgi:hypothetical protein
MEMKNALRKLNQSIKFVKWNKKNNKSKLTHAFIMVGNNENDEWQFGYYNPETDKVATFTVNDSVSLNDEQDVFKKPGDKVKCINLNNVKISLEKAIEKADEIKEKHYPKETINKRIAILQNIDHGQLWNITFVTHSFKTINIKINSSDGKVIKHGVISLFEFRSKAK